MTGFSSVMKKVHERIADKHGVFCIGREGDDVELMQVSTVVVAHPLSTLLFTIIINYSECVSQNIFSGVTKSVTRLIFTHCYPIEIQATQNITFLFISIILSTKKNEYRILLFFRCIELSSPSSVSFQSC